jgi:hypothetical protein
LLSEDKDKDEEENMSIPTDEEPHGSRKMWHIDWKNASGRSITEEKYDYTEALSIFNDKTARGRDAILYEVEKSAHDSSIIKKTPILNSVKARQRKKAESDRAKFDILAKWGTRWKNKTNRLRYRILILVAVIGLLVLVISLIDAL